MCIVNLHTLINILLFDSHHPLEHKLSVIRTLFHRAETVVTTPEDKDSELKHVKTALKRCGYKEWSFKRACVKKDKSTSNQQDSASDTKNKINVVISFVQGLSKKIKRVYSQYGPRQRSNHIKPSANYLSPPKTRHPTKRNLASFIATHVKVAIKFTLAKQRDRWGTA